MLLLNILPAHRILNLAEHVLEISKFILGLDTHLMTTSYLIHLNVTLIINSWSDAHS